MAIYDYPRLRFNTSLNLLEMNVGGENWLPIPTGSAPNVLSTPITGYTPGAGMLQPTDTILQAINKLDGNIAAIPSASPAGSDTQIQFNDGGSAFGASSNLTFEKTIGKFRTSPVGCYPVWTKDSGFGHTNLNVGPEDESVGTYISDNQFGVYDAGVNDTTVNPGWATFTSAAGSVRTGYPTGSSILTITSTSAGFLPSRMTTTQRTSISTPAEGLVVYDLTDHHLYCFDGSIWQAAW